MGDRSTKPSHEELIARLSTPGWDLESGDKAAALKNRTLEELARTAHARHKKNEAVGLIRNMENALELDLIQLQQLWEYLGLPM